MRQTEVYRCEAVNCVHHYKGSLKYCSRALVRINREGSCEYFEAVKEEE